MKQGNRVLIGLIAMLLCMLPCMSVLAQTEGPEIYAEGYCVMNLQTGEVLFAKNEDQSFHPASITKVLTALVVLEHVSDLDAVVTFSDTAVNSISANSSTLTPKASVGEKMSVRDALYGMLLVSGNECAMALAEYVGGDVEGFAQLMNETAQALGAVHSHFSNPHGLDAEDHYTTPYDMALIFRAAMQNEDFAWVDSRVNYTIPATNVSEARALTMSHSLVNGTISFDGAYAGKTGRTAEAGRTLLTAAYRGTTHLVTCVMKSDDEHFYTDTEVLLEYGFGYLDGSLSCEFLETNDYVEATSNVLIREFPSIYAKQISSLSTGQQAQRLGTYAGWSRVLINGEEAYVASSYLKQIDEADFHPESSSEEGTQEPLSQESLAGLDGTENAALQEPEETDASLLSQTTAANTTVPEEKGTVGTQQTAPSPSGTTAVQSLQAVEAQSFSGVMEQLVELISTTEFLWGVLGVVLAMIVVVVIVLIVMAVRR